MDCVGLSDLIWAIAGGVALLMVVYGLWIRRENG